VRRAGALSGLLMAPAAFWAAPALAQTATTAATTEAVRSSRASSVSVVHRHSNRPLRRVKSAPATKTDAWTYDLEAGASYTSYWGPYALQDEHSVFSDFIASRSGSQLGLHHETDNEYLMDDTTLGVSLTAPVTSLFNLSAESDFSLDRIFNPDTSTRLGASYTLYYDAKTTTYVAASMSTQLETYQYGYALSYNPTLIVGNGHGISTTLGYTFGHLYDAAGAPLTALSQATYTEGLSLGLTLGPFRGLTFDFTVLPNNTTYLQSSLTEATTLRGEVEYSFRDRLETRFSVEYGLTSLPGFGDLYDSLEYEGQLKIKF